MKDREIVELFWKRSPQAVDALAMAYGTQLRRLAGNILSNPQDAEECVNDAYLGLWDSIPPARPQPLLPSLAPHGAFHPPAACRAPPTWLAEEMKGAA